MPFYLRFGIPFVILPDIRCHKVKLFARVPEHEPEEQSKIGKLLPRIAGHFFKKRFRSVNNFIMRNGKNEIFAESIPERKSYLSLVEFPLYRVFGEIEKNIIHPSHVPFHIKSKPAPCNRVRNPGPSGRF